MATETERIAHVFRRLGFGPSPLSSDPRETIPYWFDNGGAKALVSYLLNRGLYHEHDYSVEPTIQFDYYHPDFYNSMRAYFRWWLARMASSPNQLQERVTWFLHGLLPISEEGVEARFMPEYVQKLRRAAAGGSMSRPLYRVSVPAPDPGFSDDNGSFAAADIAKLAALGITAGIAPGQYGPTQVVTRGQMAIFLVKALDDFPSLKNHFVDDTGHFAEQAINRAAEIGITVGTGPDQYSPDSPVTRGQMAVFLMRSYELLLGHEFQGSAPNPFNDISGHFAETSIRQLAAIGVTGGIGNGQYGPNNPVTRDQMAVFIIRLLEYCAAAQQAPYSYRSLLHDLTIDRAMLQWLDGDGSDASNYPQEEPNENYARELMELFTMGPLDVVTGVPNYTEGDIGAMARALAGWRIEYDAYNEAGRPYLSAFFDPNHADDQALYYLGANRPAGNLATRYQQVVDACLDVPATARFIARKAYVHFVGLEPSVTKIDELAGVFRDSDWNVHALVSAVAHSDEFLSDGALYNRVKTPVEYAVSMVRALRPPRDNAVYDPAVHGLLDLISWEAGVTGYELYNAANGPFPSNTLYNILFDLAQVPGYPPSVGGWPPHTTFASSAGMIYRMYLANRLCTNNRENWWDEGAFLTNTTPVVESMYEFMRNEASADARAQWAFSIIGIPWEGASQRSVTAVAEYLNASAASASPERAAGGLMLAVTSPDFNIK